MVYGHISGEFPVEALHLPSRKEMQTMQDRRAAINRHSHLAVKEPHWQAAFGCPLPNLKFLELEPRSYVVRLT